MKRYFFFAFTVLFLLFFSTQNICASSATSHCVIDALTGRVLYEKNAHTKRGMASTTKIVTAIVALESALPESVATVSEKASRTEGSSLYLKPGEKMSISDLVYGLMLNSGNDAAVVIAEHIGGSVDDFAKMMNELAKKIGASNTHFTNPNGLYDEQHYTTAYDLAIITQYALKNERFKKIVSTKKYTIETIGESRKIYLSNHNKLLNTLDGCDGVKTGFTKKTGRCLVSSTTRDGWQTICVTLNAPDDWNDHKSLTNQAFSEYKKKKIISKGQVAKTVYVENGVNNYVDIVVSEDVFAPVKEGAAIDFEILYNQDKKLAAPLAENEKVGTIELKYNDITFATVDAITNAAVEITKKASYFDKLMLILKTFL